MRKYIRVCKYMQNKHFISISLYFLNLFLYCSLINYNLRDFIRMNNIICELNYTNIYICMVNNNE